MFLKVLEKMNISHVHLGHDYKIKTHNVEFT